MTAHRMPRPGGVVTTAGPGLDPTAGPDFGAAVNNHIDQNRPPCIPDHSVPVYCPGCADEDEQPVSAASSAVRSPATDRTALREQVAARRAAEFTPDGDPAQGIATHHRDDVMPNGWGKSIFLHEFDHGIDRF